MTDAGRKALESEILFYITAALVTFLAFIISFKWVYRKTARKNVCPVHPDGDKGKSITEDKSLQASSGGDGESTKESIADDDEDDIQDLLINHDDIEPLDSEQTNENEHEGEGDDIESKTQHLAGPQKTKKLVEEVSKMMSDEQKQEERRIQSEQLEAIFKLVQNQQDTFGIGSLEDIEDQFKLYA
nr:matrix-remodeling-associated protein 7-like [Lytechinus pictus]XP_054762579.1 matrix-remodeling-associated protein 7-like [Lytechinus pictus]XP_054762580.1 matrix-remodeling-associated protein 7-like [Lytechinus pictus]